MVVGEDWEVVVQGERDLGLMFCEVITVLTMDEEVELNIFVISSG